MLRHKSKRTVVLTSTTRHCWARLSGTSVRRTLTTHTNKDQALVIDTRPCTCAMNSIGPGVRPSGRRNTEASALRPREAASKHWRGRLTFARRLNNSAACIAIMVQRKRIYKCAPRSTSERQHFNPQSPIHIKSGH